MAKLEDAGHRYGIRTRLEAEDRAAPGSESRQPMAIATAAGMFSSTLLTLLVVPAFHLVLDDAVARLRGRLRGSRSPAPARPRTA